MKTFFDDVGEFHRKFNLPVAGTSPSHLLSEEIMDYRCNFMLEELMEFREACERGDQASMLDALVDLAWVAMGTAHFMAAPFNEAWAEVVRANMSKVLKKEDDGEHKRGVVETIRKPLGWQAPNIEQVLDIHNATVLERML